MSAGTDINIENYRNADIAIELGNWKLKKLTGTCLLVQYLDGGSSETNRNGIILKVDEHSRVWRVGRVKMAGTECEHFKEGDVVLFPNDKGIKTSELNGWQDVVMINEGRVFGWVEAEEGPIINGGK